MSEKLLRLVHLSLPYLSYLLMLALLAFALWTGYQCFERLSGTATSGDLLSTAQAMPFVPPAAPTESLVTRLKAFSIFTVEDLAAIPEIVGLTIKGIFLNEDDTNSRALISLSGGGAAGSSTESYAIGQSLPNGASLYEIFPDRVLFLQDSDLVKASLNLPGIIFPTELPQTLFNSAKKI